MDGRREVPTDQARVGDIRNWMGMDIFDPSGDKIGEVEDVYYDEATQQPDWLLVGVGWFGRARLIPVTQIGMTDRGLQVPYSKDQVKESPAVKGEIVNQAEEQELSAYYGLEYTAGPGDACEPAAETKPGIDTASIEGVDVSRAVLREQRLAQEREGSMPGATGPTAGRTALGRRYTRPSECARVSRRTPDERMAS